jgi:tetratricopeptide (TPR) repeat protein
LNVGQHAEAIADFDKAIEASDDDEGLYNNFAWVLATSPDDALRDGKRALELATKAAELTGYETPHVLSTLAAAYAESGDFETAKKWSAKAVEISQKKIETAESDAERTRLKADHDQLQKELVSYQEGKPVRERQTGDEKSDSPPETDQTQTPAATPAPAGTSDL